MSSSSTGDRVMALYANCAAEGRRRPRSRAIRTASAIRSAGQLSTPQARSFPVAITRSMAVTSSPIGIESGGFWQYSMSR